MNTERIREGLTEALDGRGDRLSAGDVVYVRDWTHEGRWWKVVKIVSENLVRITDGAETAAARPGDCYRKNPGPREIW